MSLRYGKLLHFPRQLVKYTLSTFAYPVVKKIYRFPKVKTIDETLDKLLTDGASISRFGDGEFLYIIDKLNLPFQQYEPELAEKLKAVLKSTEKNHLVGLPIGMSASFSEVIPSSRVKWQSHIAWIYPRLKKFLATDTDYYNAHITRVYMTLSDKEKSKLYFQKLKRLWRNRKVLLVEGEKSRLGVGNDLFADAVSVERILGPAHHSFSRYYELMDVVGKHNKDKLVLLALGPTATAMAYDLTLAGYQALDIGNIDIEYEWYLKNADRKEKISGKYTSEAVGGREVADLPDTNYQEQILEKIL